MGLGLGLGGGGLSLLGALLVVWASPKVLEAISGTVSPHWWSGKHSLWGGRCSSLAGSQGPGMLEDGLCFCHTSNCFFPGLKCEELAVSVITAKRWCCFSSPEAFLTLCFLEDVVRGKSGQKHLELQR